MPSSFEIRSRMVREVQTLRHARRYGRAGRDWARTGRRRPRQWRGGHSSALRERPVGERVEGEFRPGVARIVQFPGCRRSRRRFGLGRRTSDMKHAIFTTCGVLAVAGSLTLSAQTASPRPSTPTPAPTTPARTDDKVDHRHRLPEGLGRDPDGARTGQMRPLPARRPAGSCSPTSSPTPRPVRRPPGRRRRPSRRCRARRRRRRER